MRTSRIAGAVVAAMIVACTTAEQTSPRASTRDSAGIRIVENAAPRWTTGSAWQIDSTPRFEIDVSALGSPPWRISSARRLADGRIAIAAQHGEFSLYIFDSTGRELVRAGRRGGGPGEFRYGGIERMETIAGDTLVAAGYEGLTYFDSSGRYVRREAVPVGALFRNEPDSAVSARRSTLAMHVIPDGSVVARLVLPTSSRAPPGVSREAERLMLRRSGDSAFALLGDFPGTEWVQFGFDYEGGRYGNLRVFGRETLFAAAGDRIAICPDNGAYSIHVYAREAIRAELLRPTMIVRRQIERVPLPARVRERFANATFPNRTGEERIVEERSSREMPLPDTLPAVWSLRGDRVGNLWVREVRPDTSSVRPVWREGWTVYSRDGVLLGDVRIPIGVGAWEIGADYVLASRRDSLDVTYVGVYNLRKPEK